MRSSSPQPRSSVVELRLVGEAEEVRALGQIGGRTAPPSATASEKQLEQPRALGEVPRRQREPAARAQDAGELRGRLFGTPEVEDQEVADHGVEGGILERELVRVGLAELELGMKPAGDFDHRGGDVDPDHRGAPLGGAAGRVAGAGRQVEHPRAGPDPGGVEQRLDQAPGDLRRGTRRSPAPAPPRPPPRTH